MFVLGVTVYAFLTLSARALGPQRYATLSGLWALVYLAGPGVFFPIEQEVSRAVATRTAAGLGIGPVVRRAGTIAAGLATVLALLALAFRRSLLHRVFDDQELVLAGFVLSLYGYAALHLARGLLAGGGRFRPYAVVLGGEGVLRLAAAGAILLLGVRTAGPLGIVVGLSPFAAVLVATARQRNVLTPGPQAPWRELFSSLGFLLMGSLLAQVLIHAGPLAVRLLADDRPKELTAQFFAGVLLTRIPLFLFFAVQAPLLPRLAGFAAVEDWTGFARSLRRLLGVVVAIGAASVVGAFLAGRQVIEILFGAAFVLDARGVTLLAGSSALIMAAQVLGQSVVALEGQAAAAVCWAFGAVSFVAVTALGNDPLLRVELGLVAGAAAAAAFMSVALFSRWPR